MKKVKEIIEKFVHLIQKILIFSALFLLYIFGFGLTFIFAFIFNRRLLGMHAKDKDSYWIETQGYAPDMEGCTRES